MVDTPTENINIQLGDIIEILAPENPELNLQEFYIDFINQDKVKLINIDNNKEVTINIIDGELEDQTISQINLLSRAETSSYAKQHNLVPGVWIQIFFKTADSSIKGLINNLEEDMIEIKTYPDEDIIYIDFAYEGIPEDFNIEKIDIISNPSQPESLPESLPPLESYEPDFKPGISVSQTKIDIEDATPELVNEQIMKAITDADQIEFGEDLEEFSIFVEVPESQKRYSLQQQTDDILDELLGTVPSNMRTNKVLNEIHTTIERFVQLRNLFSDFDLNGNPIIPDNISNNYVPLVKPLSNLEISIPWMIPVSSNRKKIYDVDKVLIDDLGYTSILNLDLGPVLFEEESLFSQFKKGQITTDDNTYFNYMESINELYTPFQEPVETNSIINKPVSTNILSIINNLEDNTSVVVDAASKDGNVPKTKSFLFEKYIKPIKYLDSERNLTNPDTITVNSVITLPYSYLLYSKTSLPTTNILEKSVLDENYLYYKNVINNKSQIDQSTTIESLINGSTESEIGDTEDILSSMKKDMFKNLQQYSLDESLYYNPSNSDTYEKFLQKVLPNNFECLSVIKKISKNKLSIFSLIQQLEIFNIYQNDVNYNFLQKLENFINNNIDNYKAQLFALSKKYLSYSSQKFTQTQPSKWFSILEKHSSINTIVLNAYDLKPTFTDTELFNRIYQVDYGKLFTIALVRINLDLQTNDLLDEFVQKYQDSISGKSTSQNICKTITNKYTSLEVLESTNGKEIYVDQQYDKTDYIFLEQFKEQQAQLGEEEFKQFIIDKLVELKQLDMESAEKEATILLTKQKLVENGDYAILESDSEPTSYYKRVDNVWQLDSEISGIEIKDNKLFCNLQEECLSDNNKCLTMKEAEEKLGSDAIKKIYEEFDKEFDERSKMIRREIDIILENNIERIKLLKRYNLNNFYKYDTQKRNIADRLDESPEMAVSSPYENLRDIILGQADFVKRQNYIQKFVKLFTREPFEYDDKYWLYCIKTGVKLLPLFLSTLANKFISGGDYLFELDKIATEQGTLSDDGDSFVDKYSGYFIKKIEFDTEEGYTEEGFKLKTREKMEKDLGDHVLELAGDLDKPSGLVLTGEAKLISNIVNAITGPSGMGINIQDSKQFIIDNVLELHKQLAPNKQQYDKMVVRANKLGKKIQSYEEMVGRPLVILTFIFISVAIQTNIPSIETNRTFPNCIKAFEGYPIFGDDMTAITYIACIARKMRNTEYPWSSIYSLKEEKIVSQMKDLLDSDKYKILKNPSIKLKIDEKKRFNKTKRKDIKKDIQIVERLQGFLPPLIPYSVKAYPLVEGFSSLLARNIKSGSYKQQDQINTIKSKIIKYGLSIQEKIKKIILKSDPLISSKSGKIFLENSCCDTLSTDTFEYFTNIDSTIIQDDNIVNSLSNMLYDVVMYSKAPLIYDPRDSRYYYPELPSGFTSNTIYQAFIMFCKDKNLNLSSDIQEACGLSSTIIDKVSSLDEQIELLKSDGINYSEDLFQQLLTLVNLKNSVKADLTYSHPNTVQQFTDNIENLITNPDPNIPSILVDRLKDLLDRYSLRDESARGSGRTIRNYLETENNALQEKINLFIKTNGKLSKSKYSNFVLCLRDITQFLEIGDNIIISQNDETTFKSIYFIRNILNKLVTLFPNIILNKINYQDTKIPKHWKLSSRHEKDIKEMINNYYKNLKPLYDDNDLTNILKIIKSKCDNLVKLCNSTPFFAAIQLESKSVTSVFDSTLVLLLYKFYFLKVIDIYLESSQSIDKAITKSEVLSLEQEETKEEEGESEKVILEREPLQEIPEEKQTPESFLAQATMAGIKVEKMESVAKYITTVMDIFCKYKSSIDYNKESIMKKILMSKEREKADITDYLKGMTDEEREVENIFKNQKLERWSKGLQKGLTQYVQETYDEEREQAEKELIRDRKIAQKTGVSEMNKNIYAFDLDMEEESANDIEKEEYSLEDYAGEDGNEPDYDDFEEQDEY
jgi:hypothetical protein